MIERALLRSAEHRGHRHSRIAQALVGRGGVIAGLRCSLRLRRCRRWISRRCSGTGSRRLAATIAITAGVIVVVVACGDRPAGDGDGRLRNPPGWQDRGCALTLNLVGDPEADTLLASDPLALLIGMLLDQQVPMETAFAGPKKLDDRLGGLDVHKIAEMSPDDFIAVCAQPPAVHRFPKSMGERIQSLCGYIVEHYDGDTAAIWTSGRPSGKEVLKRLKALPGTATRRPEFSWRCWVSRSAYSRRAGVRRPSLR